MRKIIFVAIWSALLAACTTDSYDSGDTPLSYLSAEWADVTTNGDGLVAYAVTDGGQRLTFSPPYQAQWLKQKADTTCRALLYHGQVVEGVTSVKGGRRRGSERRNGGQERPYWQCTSMVFG